MRCVIATFACLVFAAQASAGATIDCPLRDQAYSVDSPLLDVLLKPEAEAVLGREVPGMLEKMPPKYDQPPTFAAILTVRMAAKGSQVSEDKLAQIDRELTSLRVTDADRLARCARYDVDIPNIQIPAARPRLLVLEKITGFRDVASLAAAHGALYDMAQRNGWGIIFTEKGSAIAPSIIQQFDAIVWNNVSGDVLTLTQREALRHYIEGGGGFVGIHGAGGDSAGFWDWYVDSLLGARFAGHPSKPQFQDARVVVADSKSGITRDLPDWTMNDEWYSFKSNPRVTGVHVLATLDENTYTAALARTGLPDQDLRMGDHPIAWVQCLGQGRSFYSAIGHRPESYSEPHYVKLLEGGIAWAANRGETVCRAGKESPR